MYQLNFENLNSNIKNLATLLAELRICWLYLLQRGKIYPPTKKKDVLDMILNCIGRCGFS